MGAHHPYRGWVTGRWSWILVAGLCAALVVAASIHEASPYALVNALALSLAVLLAAQRLRSRLGPAGPLLAAIFAFVSVTFRAVFLPQPEILLLAAVVCAFFLVTRDEQPLSAPPPELYRRREGAVVVALRWGAAGLLLGMAAAVHPLHGALVPAAAAAAPERRRLLAWGALGIGATALWTAAIVSAGPIGDLGGVLGKAAGWKAGELSAHQLRGALDPQLAGWNLLYLVGGRNIGLLPYFFPLVLALGLWRGGGGRSALVAATLFATLAGVLTAPWNFFAGPEAIGNRWFLPLYGALWLVPARPPKMMAWSATLAISALFMWPSWAEPAASPVTPGGSYRHVAPLARRFLPVETSQRSIPGGAEMTIDGLWVRSLDSTVRPGPSLGRLVLSGDAPAELLVGSAPALGSIRLRFGRRAGTHLEVLRGEVGETVLRPDGGVEFAILLQPSSVRHSVWWSEGKASFYLVSFRMPGASDGERVFSIEGRTPEEVGLK